MSAAAIEASYEEVSWPFVDCGAVASCALPYELELPLCRLCTQSLKELAYIAMALTQYDQMNASETDILRQAGKVSNQFVYAKRIPEVGRVQAVVLTHREFYFAAFPGSQNVWKDWGSAVGNGNIGRAKDNGGHVHRGFFIHLTSLWNYLLHLSNQDTGKKFEISGYSRCGAIAALAALFLKNDDRIHSTRFFKILSMGQRAVFRNQVAETLRVE